MGLRVQLIDADPQGSLSQAFFGSSFVETLDASETLSALFDDHCRTTALSALAKPTSWDGLSIVCSNQTLAEHNRPSPEASGFMQFAMSEFLQDAAGCDVALIDCPPNLYQCTWNALLAADSVVIPVPPEDSGAQGLRAVHQAIDSAAELNGRLHLLGHLVTRSDGRLLVHRSYEAKLRDLYGETVFETVIPEASAFKVALACRKPVVFWARSSKAASLTFRLAGEILDRITATDDRTTWTDYGQYA